MARTQADIARQMIQQLRVLDPSVSAELGTPERKIIDTVAQAIADAQVDLTALSGQLDVDSKFGSNLDKFLAVLGFARQQATAATGVATFSRTTASTVNITVPVGTQIATGGSGSSPTTFLTTADVILPAGSLSIDVPIRCVTPGTLGNVAANTITVFVGAPTLGVTAVTNAAATINGTDAESDDELKIRFRNTVFRNVSGTEDQYLALAAATAYTTKANVVGPISRYREYIQIPAAADGGGSSGPRTSALSTIPYSKYTYASIPAFVSNGAVGALAQFYTQDLDFVLNTTAAAKNHGDALAQAGIIDPTSDAAASKPNVTFLDVYTGTDGTVVAPRPLDVVLFEHSYLSNQSRNDFPNKITNCVDVFIDGKNPTQATIIIPPPQAGSPVFSLSSASRLYAENFRRIGEAEHRPVAGNYFTGLLFQPVLDLPDSIQVGSYFYDKGLHYWAVEEVSDIGGTIRSRNGIEWAATVPGRATGDPAAGPFSGPTIIANTATSAEVANFTYDKNIVDLQSSMEAAKQVTTDPLAHRARIRYFRLDITVMYTPGSSVSLVNSAIHDALATFLAGQYFGTVIQLSDLLQVIHNVSGVDNVRWTTDVDATKNRVTETDLNGSPLINGVTDRIVAGGITNEKQSFYFANPPTVLTDTYVLTFGTTQTSAIAYNASASTVLARLTAASIPVSTVTGSGTVADPFVVTFSSTLFQTNLLQVTSAFTHSSTTLNSDFFLKDNELPALPSFAGVGDTVPGLVIRPRAQNTFNA